MSETLKTPKHLVIVPDGNGRWAERHNLPVSEGHYQGSQRIMEIVESSEKLDIDVLTLWGFSTENWSRDQGEVEGILSLSENLIDKYRDRFTSGDRQFRHVGRKDRLPASLLDRINQLEADTKNASGKTFVLAFDYGGRDEIVRAANQAHHVDQITFSSLLDTAGLPDPDLIIRTSGEMRTSGIYPYQATYAEFISSPVLFPDFDQREFQSCLNEYARRNRRFGTRQTTTRNPLEWVDGDDYKAFVTALLPKLADQIPTFLDKWRSQRYFRHSPELNDDIDIYTQLLEGGKKFRPSLIVLGFETFNGEPEYFDQVLATGIGYETLHNSFLVHDDIEDNSPTRRGNDAVHEIYRKSAPATKSSDPSHYGLSIALNTGSLGAFQALSTIQNLDIPTHRRQEANTWLNYVVVSTLAGQRKDLSAIDLSDLTPTRVYEIHHEKTAVYTVTGPLVLGAILAGASRRDQAWLNTFGSNLGIAFQIVDDHLGLYGDEKVIGKPVKSDTSEAKKTLQFAKTYELATPDEQEFLKSKWGKVDLSDDEFSQVKALVTSLEVPQWAINRAKLLGQKSRGVIPKITSSPKLASIYEDLIYQMIDRSF